jgi:glutaredoxin 3
LIQEDVGQERRVLTLWQAEWCPYSARVRQTMTELGVDFVAKQVDAEREDRDAMRRSTGRDEIPLLVLGDGTQIADWHEMIRHLRETYGERADGDRHREKSFEEAAERDPRHELA